MEYTIFMKITAAKLKKWRNGASGFLQWVADVQPRIPSSKGGFEIFIPVDFQIEAVKGALDRDKVGNYKHLTICLSFPRRHSKSTLAALIVLWRFFNFQSENIAVLANSLDQAEGVSFKILKKIVLNTPVLLEMIGADNVQKKEIKYPGLQSIIRAVTSSSSALYGSKLSAVWITEIHAAADDSAMQVLLSSIGDTVNAFSIIDSTVDSMGGPLHRLQQLAESGQDPTIFYYERSYRDLAEALEKSPPWISKAWLKSRSLQLLPAEFGSQHLNRRSEAHNSLFALADIQAASENYPNGIKYDIFKDMISGRNHVVGGGLDRAYFGSVHNDKTVWTTVAKVSGIDGVEPEYYVLNQQKIFGSLGHGIKKAITADMKEYGLKSITVESFNSQDIHIWALDQGYNSEIVHPTMTTQTPAFMELHRIVAEKRFHFPRELKNLESEMQSFIYTMKAGKPSFGSERVHDDFVYSLAWAVYSLRESELASYVISSIVCNSKSSHQKLCYLRSSNMILPCADECPAHRQVLQMYNQYKTIKVDSEITLPEFFRTMVKITGARVYQAA